MSCANQEGWRVNSSLNHVHSPEEGAGSEWLGGEEGLGKEGLGKERLGKERLGAAEACAVGAEWVGSQGSLVYTTEGGVSAAVPVSSVVVLWCVSVVESSSLDGSVSKTVVAAGVVEGVEGRVVRAGEVGVAVMSVSVEEESLAEGSLDEGEGAAVEVAPFGAGFDFGGDFNSLDLGESEEGGGECEFHCVV